MSRNTYIEGMKYDLPHPFRQDSERLAAQFYSDTYKDSNYVLRWKSNDRVPPQEVLDFWKYIGKRFNMSKSITARNRESKRSIEQYKKSMRNHKYSEEELSEMRAVYGKGEVIVDIITGEKIKL